MKRRRLLLALGAALAVLVALIALPRLVPPQPGVTEANCARIKRGMQQDEVEAILGGPPGRYQIGLLVSPTDSFARSIRRKAVRWSSMLNIRCILHPTDFSQPSANAFLVARALARDYGARLLLLHVHQAPIHGIAGEAPAPPPTRTDREGLENQLHAVQAANPEIRIEYRLAEGNPATTILDVAREMACDVIVMGTHGRTGRERLLMGSVAENTVRSAACPVLAVKTPLFDPSPTRGSTAG